MIPYFTVCLPILRRKAINTINTNRYIDRYLNSYQTQTSLIVIGTSNNTLAPKVVAYGHNNINPSYRFYNLDLASLPLLL
jgi:hypothetical protein